MAIKFLFHIDDTVKWKDGALGDAMKQKYGVGPFTVVGVRLHTRSFREGSPDAHPEEVTIELPSEERQSFSGDHFTKD